MNDETITTPYGTAYVIARTGDGGLLVVLPKDKMTTQHPKYRGGPCVLFIHYPRSKPSDLIGRITK